MIKEYPNFLTEDECNYIIAMSESNDLSTGRTSNKKNYGYRKAKVFWLDNNEELVLKIKKQVSNLSKITIENQEKLHFVKYINGGEYKLHHDGKDRIKTALIYLNVGYKGGETEFPLMDRKIKPEVGKLIIWDNYYESGEKIEESKHAGLPVEFGTKYIGVIWIRNKKYEIR